MITKYQTPRTTQYVVRILGYDLFIITYSRYVNVGWFDLCGVFVSWHNQPTFSMRHAGRKYLKIGNCYLTLEFR